MSKKVMKICGIVMAILLILVLITIGVYYFWPWHRGFFNNADKEFSIPGLDEAFVPQGMTELVDYNKYLISGYMDDGTPSRFYIVDAETKEVEKYVILQINDSKLYDGHAGGVASYGSNIWTTSSADGKGYAFRFEVNKVLSAENGATVQVKDYFDTYNNADFVFVQNKTLWVGEFYKEGKYETDTDHHVETSNGEINKAIIYGFNIDESRKYALSESTPAKAISVGDLCQGIAITSSGDFIVSTSYSIADSNIYYHKNILKEEAPSELEFGLSSIPLWFLDNDSLIKKVSIPAMSEEIFVKNNRVYILFESASKKYKMFNRVRLDSVYSVDIDYFAN